MVSGAGASIAPNIDWSGTAPGLGVDLVLSVAAIGHCDARKRRLPRAVKRRNRRTDFTSAARP